MLNKEPLKLRQEQAAESRRKLLDSAQKLFAESGYKGTSVRCINRNVDLGDGLLYHYFPGGKKEIFQVIVVRNFNEILDSIEQRNTSSNYANLSMEELLDQVFLSFEEVVEQHLDIIRIVFREPEVREFITQEQLTQVLGNRRKWLPPILESRIESGEIKKMDCESAAVMLSSVMMNHLMAKALDLGCSILDIPEQRKRLIQYQISLWKSP